MARVVAGMTVSLDGFVADRDDGVDELFRWYDNGDVAIPMPGSDMVFHTTEASAAYLRDLMRDVGAVVSGRRLFDITDGWGGSHPFGVPVVVVTHHVPEGWPRADAPFTFVTDGVASAIDQAARIAGDGIVAVGGASLAQQCLDLGLLDELLLDLAPVVLGDGIRFFEHLAHAPVRFDDPRVVAGREVTHLHYRVRRDPSTR
jgi:dihydrofolate reductase